MYVYYVCVYTYISIVYRRYVYIYIYINTVLIYSVYILYIYGNTYI